VTAEKLLACRDLALGREGIPLCGGVEFSLCAGAYMTVISADDRIKKSLFETILGLEPPMSGQVLYERGVSRKDIGYLPKEQTVRGNATARQIVLEGGLYQSGKWFVGKAEKELAMYNLERVGLADLAKRPFRELSGGQRQRVLLARALCGAKKLLLLDDPMQGLDANAQDELFSRIVEIHQNGLAVMIADPKAVDGTVLHLSDRQLFCGPVEDYAASDCGRAYYLGYTM